MSIDGKIADIKRSPARFSSVADRKHLEKQLALVDAALFGAGTLRAYGTTLPITDPQLLQWRQEQHKPPQPIHIVCSASGQLDPHLRFFRQKVPRWLLTTDTASQLWQADPNYFEHVLTLENWSTVLEQFNQSGIKKLAILGGGELVASLMAEDLIDEFWLTLCPVILGGVDAPSPVEGMGFLASNAPFWELSSVERLENELFLNYRRVKASAYDTATNLG